jgi:hypothetical protein
MKITNSMIQSKLLLTLMAIQAQQHQPQQNQHFHGKEMKVMVMMLYNKQNFHHGQIIKNI